VIAAHGNSLRALIMVLEELSPEGILKRELGTGVPIIYRQPAVHRRRKLKGVGSTLMSHNVLSVAQIVGFGPGKSKMLYLSMRID
jgi:hypothetical protein